MKRREAIRRVVLISAGAAFLYQCKEKEQDLMTELTEFILPATNLKNADFVIMMADDLLPPDQLEKFKAGMKAFTDKGFTKMSPEERDQYVTSLEGDAKVFYEMVKQGTIENFVTSEEYLRDVKGITTLIPGKFQGCIEVTKA